MAVVDSQIRFLKDKDLGLDTRQIVLVPIFQTDQFSSAMDAAKLATRYQTVKQAFLNHPDAIEATAYRWWLGRGAGQMRSVEPEGHDKANWRMPVMEVDEDYLSFFGIDTVAGRRFDPLAFPADTSRAFILNETARQDAWLGRSRITSGDGYREVLQVRRRGEKADRPRGGRRW